MSDSKGEGAGSVFLGHQRRGCAAQWLAYWARATERLGQRFRFRWAVIKHLLRLETLSSSTFSDISVRRCEESTPKPSRQWRRAGRVSGVEVWAGPPPPLLRLLKSTTPVLQCSHARSASTVEVRPWWAAAAACFCTKMGISERGVSTCTRSRSSVRDTKAESGTPTTDHPPPPLL